MKDNLTSIGSQVRYHSNRLDQIDRLIHAAEADEDIAYLARLLALCSLPRTNPGNRKEYVRRNGPFTLALTAGFDIKLPFGYITRLLLAWVCTEAVRTQSQDLTLGKTLSDFMRVVGIDPAGAAYARVRNQIEDFLEAALRTVRTEPGQGGHGQERCERFPRQSHPGTDKDQDRVARPGLCHASGSPGIVAVHRPIGPSAHEGRPDPAGRPVPIRRSAGFKFLHNRRGAYYVFLMTTCS